MAPRNRKSMLGEIRNPLIFFGLALLVIEGIIGLVVGTAHVSEKSVIITVFVMAGLFLVVVSAVAIITIKWPAHLYEEVQRDIQWNRQSKEFINGKAFRDAVKDVISEVVKPEYRALSDKEKK